MKFLLQEKECSHFSGDSLPCFPSVWQSGTDRVGLSLFTYLAGPTPVARVNATSHVTVQLGPRASALIALRELCRSDQQGAQHLSGHVAGMAASLVMTLRTGDSTMLTILSEQLILQLLVRI